VRAGPGDGDGDTGAAFTTSIGVTALPRGAGTGCLQPSAMRSHTAAPCSASDAAPASLDLRCSGPLTPKCTITTMLNLVLANDRAGRFDDVFGPLRIQVLRERRSL
jgi:hypothetical protein